MKISKLEAVTLLQAIAVADANNFSGDNSDLESRLCDFLTGDSSDEEEDESDEDGYNQLWCNGCDDCESDDEDTDEESDPDEDVETLGIVELASLPLLKATAAATDVVDYNERVELQFGKKRKNVRLFVENDHDMLTIDNVVSIGRDDETLTVNTEDGTHLFSVKKWPAVWRELLQDGETYRVQAD